MVKGVKWLTEESRIEARRSSYRKYVSKDREYTRNYQIGIRARTIKAWVDLGIIPAVTKCQMCEKNIFLLGSKRSDAIHFDHQHGAGFDHAARGVEPVRHQRHHTGCQADDHFEGRLSIHAVHGADHRHLVRISRDRHVAAPKGDGQLDTMFFHGVNSCLSSSGQPLDATTQPCRYAPM